MYEDICYKRTYLTEVVARIDFASPVSSFDKALSPKFIPRIVKYFPIVEPIDVNTVGVQFQIGGDNNPEKTNIRTKQWNFFGREREKQLLVASGFMFVRYTRYTSYEKLKDELIEAVDAIDKEQPGTIAQRIGLRYINKFDIEGIQLRAWGALVSPHLLRTLDFFDENTRLTRLFNVAELRTDDLDVRLQFGFPNEDFPAVIKRPTFVLDIDAYASVAHAITESPQLIELAHSQIQDLFEKSITDELRGKMNG